jgi:hypothetical protein
VRKMSGHYARKPEESKAGLCTRVKGA